VATDHVIPSVEEAIVVVPSPTATKRDPFQAIFRQRVKGEDVIPDQVYPFEESAREFVPSPPESQ
jgi:hypothetical protein